MSVQVRFREVQAFHQPWLWAILCVPPTVLLYGLYRQVMLRQPFGNRPMSNVGLAAIVASLLLFAGWFWQVKLITEVRDDELWVRFDWLFTKRRVPFGEIRRVAVVSYSPIGDYGGWGVRFGSRGRAYTVSGNRGVDVELRDGGRFLIGSARPEELVSALEARLGARA